MIVGAFIHFILNIGAMDFATLLRIRVFIAGDISQPKELFSGSEKGVFRCLIADLFGMSEIL
jgi:hypothetical protein